MKNSILIALGLLYIATFNSCKKAEPEPTKYKSTEYKIDAFTTGGSAVFQGGFEIGERAAVVLGPINETFIVRKVQFMFGGGTGARDVIIRIYWDNGVALPGDKLYEGTHSITPDDNALQTIDLSDKEITFHGGGSFRVAIGFTHTGFPSIARDDDGAFDKTKNYVLSQGNWIQSFNFGLSDDFIIRALVDTKL